MRPALGRRFSRLATTAVVRVPWLWALFRGSVRRQFDAMAPRWESIRGADHLASFEAGLELLPHAPRRALDVGTGTGAGAAAIAARFPRAEVVGVDLAPAMIEEARRRVSGPEFVVGDASGLPYEDGRFDLVALANMIPFFDEVARLVAPGGHALFSFSGGAGTPIYVPPERLERELRARGFTHFAALATGRGTGLLARKGDLANTPA